MDKKSFDQIIAELRASKKHNTSDYNERYPERADKHKNKILEYYNSEKYKNYLNSTEYKHPKGMLGKIRSADTRLKSSNSLSGQTRPIEGNKKISNARIGLKHKKETIDKMRNTMKGRESGRSREVMTPNGKFNKLIDAVVFYNVDTATLKRWCDSSGTGVRNKNMRQRLLDLGVKFDSLWNPIGFYWIDPTNSKLKAKKVQTPDGIFNNAKEASIYYKITEEAIRERIKVRQDWCYL